jgi:hypothetical protein
LHPQLGQLVGLDWGLARYRLLALVVRALWAGLAVAVVQGPSMRETRQTLLLGLQEQTEAAVAVVDAASSLGQRLW